MPKVAHYVPLAGIALDRQVPASLARQLYDGLREAILRRQLRPGTRLPSTRALASEFGLSRNTATSAYEQLVAEGYLEPRVGSGTIVARSLPDEIPLAGRRDTATGLRTSGVGALSKRNRSVSSRPVRPLTVTGVSLPFASGLPDVAAFPVHIWARLTARQWRKAPSTLLTYGDPAGYLPLRQAIATHVRTSRAVECEADQVLVLSGSQQALDLAARVLIDPGDGVLVEDPGYPGARAAFGMAGASVLSLPVDSEGADINRVLDRARKSRLAFVTPSHQYPLGVTMTVSRRLAVIEWARRSGAWIIEDDYDSEYRYRGKPLPSLQGLDRSGRVIYMGSFSKTLFPSLRLGFVVLPPALVEPFRRVRSVVDGHSPLLEQAVLAEFIAEGHFSRHVRRMRALYQERQSILVETAARELRGLLRVQAADGGMHLVGWLPRGASDVAASERGKSCGVFVSPLSMCAAAPRRDRGLLLGYAAFGREQILEGVRRLAGALRSI
jgi:GntR family transcriptional regulator/MocR family aminotransferase